MMCCDIAKVVPDIVHHCNAIFFRVDLEDGRTTILQNSINYSLSMSAYTMFSIKVVGLSNLTSPLMVLCLLSMNYAKLRHFI
jgi:hypothetical protein